MTAPVHKHRFCVEQALEAGEPVEGWGGHGARHLMIRWPKKQWRYAVRVGEGMTAEQEALINDIAGTGRRVGLIDRKSTNDPLLRVFLRPEMVAFDLEPEELTPFLQALARDGDLEPFRPAPMASRQVLCCTHGTHDKCCAKWGFAAYKAIAAEARNYGDFDVWEATHLGGCRLASSTLFFPAEGGVPRAYGRATPSDAPGLLAAEAAGRPYPARFKGTSTLSAAEQVAEVTALRAFEAEGLTVSVPTVERVSGEERVQTFSVAMGLANATVKCEQRPLVRYGNCINMAKDAPIEDIDPWFGTLLSLDRGDHH